MRITILLLWHTLNKSVNVNLGINQYPVPIMKRQIQTESYSYIHVYFNFKGNKHMASVIGNFSTCQYISKDNFRRNSAVFYTIIENR